MKASILAFAAACLFANGQPVRSSTDLPFTMSWSRGACSRCLLDGALEYIQFVTRSEVWGVSHAWPPPGTEGVGDYVAVHSQDGGRTWTEIRYTQTHAAAPSVFFADPENGWLVWLEVHPAGEIKMQRTRDGGRTWQQVSSGIDRFPELRDETHWYAIDGDKFLRTDDGGRTWRETRIPGMQYGGIHFLSNDVGWIANGTLEGRATVFRTVDGGDTWTESHAPATPRVARIADLFFLDSQRGWLIAEHSADEGSHLFSTTDGGATWRPEADASFQGRHRYLGPIRFVSERVGFLFEQDTSEEKRALAYIIYTTDGGAHWRRVPLPHPVTACQLFEGDLRCSASDAHFRFWLLTVRPR